jgi:protein TonB
MFDQLVVSSSAKRRKTRLRYFSVTAAVWIAALALVVVGGVWSYDARLSDTEKFISLAPPPPPLRGTPPRHEQKRESIQQASRQQNEMVAQVKSPDHVSDTSRVTLPPIVGTVIDPGANGPTGPGVGSDHGVVGGLGEVPERSRQPEPPQPEKKKEEPAQPQPQPRTQVVRSGGVLQGTAIRRVNPVYPPLARCARVSGVVVVEVVVDQTGNVTSARALSGHALLREAAVASATQWKWNPTLLSRVPVQVVGTITFNFTL